MKGLCKGLLVRYLGGNMKFFYKTFFLFLLIMGLLGSSTVPLCSATNAFAQDIKILFLHHSTGANLYEEGKISQWFEKYNLVHKTFYRFFTRSYPGLKPFPMSNYPYDYWNLWVNNACENSSKQDRPCIDELTKEYDVIIFKHCYPGSDIRNDTGFPQINSDQKTIENYKLQYRALRKIMDEHPATIFIIWTLAPRNRIATTYEMASRAHKFVKWTKNDFLKEDGKEHFNIFIFDFWGFTAEQNKKPKKGETYCLKWEYERTHGKRDSHPNEMANRIIAPEFAKFIVNSIQVFQGNKF